MDKTTPMRCGTFYFAFAIIRMALQMFCFRAVSACAYTLSCKPLTNFVVVGDKEQLIRIWSQKVKGHDHSKTTCGKNTSEGIFSSASRMCGHILIKLGTVTC